MEGMAAEGAQQGAQLVAYLFTVSNGLIMLAAAIVVATLRRLVPALRSKESHWHRVTALLPAAFCMAFLWVPGMGPESGGVGERLLLGIVLGALALNVHKFLQKLGLGWVAEALGLSIKRRLRTTPAADTEGDAE